MAVAHPNVENGNVAAHPNIAYAKVPHTKIEHANMEPLNCPDGVCSDPPHFSTAQLVSLQPLSPPWQQKKL